MERIEQALSGAADGPHQQSEARGAEAKKRNLTLFRTGVITVAGTRELCVIRSICGNSMQIRTFAPITAGERVSVEFKHGAAISGTAQWAKGNLVSVNFDQPIEIGAILSTDPTAPVARMPRIEIERPVAVREEARIVRARAFDISQGGVRVDCTEKLTVGGNVVVTIAGLDPEPAVVRWHRDGRYGLGFNRVMPLAILADWLRSNRLSDDDPPRAAASAS